MKATSALMQSATPGCTTFRTTSSPPLRSLALCTCATEAAASGWSHTERKTSPSGRPSCAVTTPSMADRGSARALSQHTAMVSVISFGMIDTCAATAWPIFTWKPPFLKNMSRAVSASFLRCAEDFIWSSSSETPASTMVAVSALNFLWSSINCTTVLNVSMDLLPPLEMSLSPPRIPRGGGSADKPQARSSCGSKNRSTSGAARSSCVRQRSAR
mmetsp:Transcript_25221/g.72717  ORF Transcript_25221/g.72717 Transcript_25221/m.72717 type:complete len:215 (+) Transcript_25221:1493-2137(+)